MRRESRLSSAQPEQSIDLQTGKDLDSELMNRELHAKLPGKQSYLEWKTVCRTYEGACVRFTGHGFSPLIQFWPHSTEFRAFNPNRSSTSITPQHTRHEAWNTYTDPYQQVTNANIYSGPHNCKYDFSMIHCKLTRYTTVLWCERRANTTSSLSRVNGAMHEKGRAATVHSSLSLWPCTTETHGRARTCQHDPATQHGRNATVQTDVDTRGCLSWYTAYVFEIMDIT